MPKSMQNFLFFKIISNAAMWYFGPLNFPLYLDCLCTINIMYTWNNPYILTHVNYSHCMGVWGHTIILTPCPTTWSACSSTGKWAVMYLCVKGIDFASLSLYELDIWFSDYSDSMIFVVVFFISLNYVWPNLNNHQSIIILLDICNLL